MDDLDALAALVERATPGPWTVRMGEYVVPAGHEKRPIGGSSDPVVDRDRYAQYVCRIPPSHRHRSDTEQRANAELIVAAVNALPALIARVRAQEAALVAADAMRSWMKGCCDIDAAHAYDAARGSHG